jgi:hypothetical protein
MGAQPPRNHIKRPYHRSGEHVITRALPYLLERVADQGIPDQELSPIERAARSWRIEVLDDLGGPESVPATKRAVLDAALGSKILLDSLDRYLFALAAEDGLVNRRNRRAFAIVSDRMRVADGLARQLQALGLERKEAPAPDLKAYLATRAGQASTTAKDG